MFNIRHSTMPYAAYHVCVRQIFRMFWRKRNSVCLCCILEFGFMLMMISHRSTNLFIGSLAHFYFVVFYECVCFPLWIQRGEREQYLCGNSSQIKNLFMNNTHTGARSYARTHTQPFGIVCEWQYVCG